MAVVALVALRIAIGWHFYKEGVAKLRGAPYSSASLLGSAKGPLAPAVRAFVWDADGLARLDLPTAEKAWKDYQQLVAGKLKFDNSQRKQAEQVYQSRRRQLRRIFNDNREEMQEYFQGLKRRDRDRQSDNRTQVASLREQLETLESDLQKKRTPWLADIDSLWDGYESELLSIGTTGRNIALKRPGRRWFDTEFIDKVLPYFVLLVGACLVLGLLTRTASIAGAGFLGMVMVTQWPLADGATPTFYQSVEFAALLVLAAVGAGRFFGMDFLMRSLRLRLFPPRGVASHESNV